MIRFHHVFLMVFLTFTLQSLAVGSPASAQLFGKSKEKRIEGIQAMRSDVLEDLYDSRPQAQQLIEDAEGYAVFSNVGVTALFVTAGGGSGVVRDQKSGTDTYMKMGTAGIGLGLGIKDFRAVFIFHDRKTLDYFVEKGWDFSGSADAAAEIDDLGGDLSEGASIKRKVTVYQFTENGLALTATLNGTKYWRDKKLNKAKEKD